MENIPQSPVKPKVSSPDMPVNTKESSWRMVGFGIGLFLILYFLTFVYGWYVLGTQSSRPYQEPRVWTSDQLLKQSRTIAPSAQ